MGRRSPRLSGAESRVFPTYSQGRNGALKVAMDRDPSTSSKYVCIYIVAPHYGWRAGRSTPSPTSSQPNGGPRLWRIWYDQMLSQKMRSLRWPATKTSRASQASVASNGTRNRDCEILKSTVSISTTQPRFSMAHFFFADPTANQRSDGSR